MCTARRMPANAGRRRFARASASGRLGLKGAPGKRPKPVMSTRVMRSALRMGTLIARHARLRLGENSEDFRVLAANPPFDIRYRILDLRRRQLVLEFEAHRRHHLLLRDVNGHEPVYE